ncbi:TonB-dependent receptor [Gaoshiqia sediminis]|uniref:Carboxypeptidase regulatory-like domain-containing protein n=1 Tax=Gaoshiqia sediminis TaxID=2986998 RepID=A0AA41YA11_9BACT|nr:carboxypeptidase regulatory-like domain-containing protein [Gaoshiqia sediminis]MCW0482020.1 carboxypeptidase regulatory-like domain-containing protein [Gaoshiqia sediminis]
MKALLKHFSLLILFLVLSYSVIAQVTTSSLSGIVSDKSGEALPGATVVAIHQPSGTQYGTVTNSEGRYIVNGMRPGGPYTVNVSFIGYSAATYTGINLNLGESMVLEASLVESSVDIGEVMVFGSAESNMRSDRAGAITNLSTRQISEMPTISRSVNDLIRLTPQATINSNGANIGGGNYRQSFVTVDGAAFNNAFGIGQNLPASGSPISLDALDQISISVTPFDVRQSGFTGASINAVTRSGDNEFSGSAYTYLNNESFKGNKVGDVSFTKNESEYKLYGIRIGGPIIKDKLFFFVNYEKEESIEPGPARVAATAANPYTDGSDNVARPTAAQMDEIKNYLISSYQYDPGAYQGYSSESPGSKFFARIDWNINNDHKFNIRYSDTKAKNPSNPSTSTSGLGDRSFTTNSRTAMTALFFENARYYQETNFSSLAGELNSRFNDGKVSNLLRVSYSHQDEPRSTAGGAFPFVDIVEDGNVYTSFGTELFSYGNLRDVKTLNVTDEVTFSIKNHNFLAGVQFEHNTTKNGFQRFGAGYYQFNTWQDFVDNNPNQFAITHSFNEDFSQAFPTFKYKQLSAYIQDEVTLSERFKMQAGIRVELPVYPDLDTYNEQVANTSLSAGDYNYPTLMKNYDTRDLPSTKLMVSPRVGFNYDLVGDRSLVLRGGSGLFTGRIPFVWIVAQSGDAGVLQTTYTATQTNGKTIPSFTSDRIAMLQQIYPSGITASTASISSVTLIDNDLKLPQTWKTSLALDAKLPGGINATLEGIINKDINPAVVTNAGIKPGAYTDIPGYADNRPYYGKYYDNTLRNAYLLTNAEKEGYYYSITAKLEKSFGFGLDAMVAYTRSESKNVTDGVGDQIASAWYTPYNTFGANVQELSYASYVMPHRLIGALSYRKEYLKNLQTTVSLFYEGGPSGRISYTYTAAVLGDGGAYNLIYVPKTKDELTFADYTFKDASGATQTYSAAQQADDFWAFVNSNDYLKDRKGRYAERNGHVYPWSHTFDLKITQDIFTKVGGKRNTLQVGLDIKNFGNLLNNKWGSQWSYTQSAVLKQTNQRAQGTTVVPVYNFVRNGVNMLDDDYTKTIGYNSTYSMQLTLRYIFN